MCHEISFTDVALIAAMVRNKSAQKSIYLFVFHVLTTNQFTEMSLKSILLICCLREPSRYGVGFQSGKPGVDFTYHKRSINAVYVLIKHVVPNVPWSVVWSSPWALSLEEVSPSVRDISKLWRRGKMVMPSILKRQKSDSYYCKMDFASKE